MGIERTKKEAGKLTYETQTGPPIFPQKECLVDYSNTNFTRYSVKNHRRQVGRF